ncbi:MAG: bifunctional glutamate N-acetyltransferase/amino-acid acetyltransferase ArgJ [Verrucomicrobiota bacterium]
MKWLKEGSITSPQGFAAAGISCGIKAKKKKDLALIVSEAEASVGAAFTTNRIKAAPVKLSMQNAKRGVVKAIVANSGNANACTGVSGIRDARSMVEKVAALIGCSRNKILVCSTGPIGKAMPIQLVLAGIEKAFKRLSRLEGSSAAKAIRTTDTTTKQCAVEIVVNGKRIRIGGMAKGAGMIHPNMATMLSFISSDALIDRKLLQHLTTELVQETFNRISVDGDTSTNDTVIVLANGLAENEILTNEHPELETFKNALREVMARLAQKIIQDGECISHVVNVQIQGASSAIDAKKVADAIARSPLVKSSWAGNDPNWGRLMDVIGFSGAKVREELIDVFYDGLCAVKGGTAGCVPPSRLRRVAKKRNYGIVIDLHLGKGTYEIWANDLTVGYVKFNMGE